MNDDDFEKKLRSLTGALHRPDPTPAWKKDILARARREADAIPLQRMLPPRGLMLTWAAAWAAILALNFTAPRKTTLRTTGDLTASTAKPMPAATRGGDLPALLALHQRMNLNLDLPQ